MCVTRRSLQAGMRMLQQGGSAADAAVAMAAALNVTEPCSTGESAPCCTSMSSTLAPQALLQRRQGDPLR